MSIFHLRNAHVAIFAHKWGTLEHDRTSFLLLGSEAFGGLARRWLVRRDGLADHPKSGAEVSR